MKRNSNDILFDLLPDRIADFYKGKTILITGGSGFVGKVLIEKLLRSCSELKLIYVLIRNKKGKDPQERLQNILEGPLFTKLKKQQYASEILKKIQPIVGDISSPELGLSKQDRQKLGNEVEIVFHCAATVRFDEPLKSAILLNVRGTKLMIQLAKEMKKLSVFVYLSTAFCHPKEKVLREQPYDVSANPHDIIKIAEILTDEIIDSITDKILGDIPNTYTFTKALAEALIVAEMDKLPVIIQRPSIIVPIWKEPLPGWTDNLNGPTGLLIGAAKGVIRTMYCFGENQGDLVPVDIIVHAMLVCTYDYFTNKKRRIFNLTANIERSVKWIEIVNTGKNVVQNEMPLNWVVWYPGGSVKSSRLLQNVCFLLFHILPALLVDFLLVIFAQKPILCRIQKRIYKGFDVLEYYANNQWEFRNDNIVDIRKNLNDKEKIIYQLDGDDMNFRNYIKDCIHAARLYLLKESDESLPTAKRHMKMMWCVDKITKLLLTICFVYYILYLRIFLPIITN